MDDRIGAIHNPSMEHAPELPLCLTRRDASLNMARFYSLDIAADLFGGAVLVRHWGRIGKTGQERREWFADPVNARRQALMWRDRKLRRGYC